jgi:hypothetical protein
MQEKFKYHKELRWLLPSEIVVKEELRFYPPRLRTDLEHSLSESKFIVPLTAILEAGQNILLDGFDRFDIVHQKGMQDKIPVWVILDPMTDQEKRKLIVDLAKQKQKNYVDYMNEYHFYSSIIPNEQGKQMGGKNRHKLIALLMGISTSQLSKLLRIDSVSPELLAAVDHEHLTLSQAEQRAKEKKRSGGRDARNTHPQLFNPDKKIDMTPPLDKCPSCHRPLTTVKWEDLPAMFDFKKDESNSQTTWLEPIKSSRPAKHKQSEKKQPLKNKRKRP